MNGRAISATIWQVSFRHLNTTPQSLIVHPFEQQKPAEKYCFGSVIVATSDPSGEDLFTVARTAVLGAKANADSEFTLIQVQRVADVKGTAQTHEEN